MRDKVKLKVAGDEATIEEGDTTFLGKVIAGTRGAIKVRGREIHKVKDSHGKVLKDDRHPENIGKVEKPKKAKRKA